MFFHMPGVRTYLNFNLAAKVLKASLRSYY